MNETTKIPSIVNRSLSRGQSGMSQTSQDCQLCKDVMACFSKLVLHLKKKKFIASLFFSTYACRNQQLLGGEGLICLISSRFKETHAIKIAEPLCSGVNARVTPKNLQCLLQNLQIGCEL